MSFSLFVSEDKALRGGLPNDDVIHSANVPAWHGLRPDYNADFLLIQSANKSEQLPRFQQEAKYVWSERHFQLTNTQFFIFLLFLQGLASAPVNSWLPLGFLLSAPEVYQSAPEG